MSYIPSQSVIDIITQDEFYFIYACELFLEDETLRLHTGIGEIVVNGYTFLGTSGIGSVGDITESDDNSTDQSVELSLSGFDASLIQGMMIDKCRGRFGRIYWVVRDMSGNMAADIMFSGRLDAAVLELGGNQEDNRLSVTISGRNAEWARDEMKKIERDGMVAVLVSPGFGAGWSTWNSEHRDTLCMDAEIVQAVLDKDIDKAVAIAKQKCGDDFFEGGARDLTVEWVKKGVEFEIDEHYGSESVHVIGNRDYMVA